MCICLCEGQRGGLGVPLSLCALNPLRCVLFLELIVFWVGWHPASNPHVSVWGLHDGTTFSSLCNSDLNSGLCAVDLLLIHSSISLALSLIILPRNKQQILSLHSLKPDAVIN